MKKIKNILLDFTTIIFIFIDMIFIFRIIVMYFLFGIIFVLLFFIGGQKLIDYHKKNNGDHNISELIIAFGLFNLISYFLFGFN